MLHFENQSTTRRKKPSPLFFCPTQKTTEKRTEPELALAPYVPERVHHDPERHKQQRYIGELHGMAVWEFRAGRRGKGGPPPEGKGSGGGERCKKRIANHHTSGVCVCACDGCICVSVWMVRAKHCLPLHRAYALIIQGGRVLNSHHTTERWHTGWESTHGTQGGRVLNSHHTTEGGQTFKPQCPQAR